MTINRANAAGDADFIRLFFKSSVEETIAHRWASRLGQIIGPRIQELRPDTTLSEMMEWAAGNGADSMTFVVVFEPELRMELADFLDDSEEVTFREMVEHYASHFQSRIA